MPDDLHRCGGSLFFAAYYWEAQKRAFTLGELQDFFDYADEQVTKARDRGRKGWLPAFRDATLFNIAYSFGLRRNETRMLDVVDIGRNPHGPEFSVTEGSSLGTHGVNAAWPQHLRGFVGNVVRARGALLEGGLFELVVEEALGDGCVSARGGVGQVEDQGKVQWVSAHAEGLMQYAVADVFEADAA